MKLLSYSCHWLTIVFLLVAFMAHSQAAQPFNYPPTEVVTIHSGVLNEERKVYVHCPKVDSADTSKRFPVLYVMDADNHFTLLAQYADYLARPDVSAMPGMIVVGIPNTKRTRDLTPTNSLINYDGEPDSISYRESGGNADFLRFIATELTPLIDSKYKTTPYRIFAGHSFGGLSSLNCLLTNPDLFDAYIAVSPSLWWDNEHLLKRTDAQLKSGSSLPKSFFFSDGNEGGPGSSFHKGLLKLEAILAKKKLKGFTYRYKHYPTETHMTEPIVAYFDALRFIFEDWEKHR